MGKQTPYTLHVFYVIYKILRVKTQLNNVFINKIRFLSDNGEKQDISIRKIVVYKNQRFLMRDYEMAGMSYTTEMLKSQRL